MSNFCYIIHSEKMVFKTELLLQFYIIEKVAKECHNKKELNTFMTKYFSDNVSIIGMIEALENITNHGYTLIDKNEIS